MSDGLKAIPVAFLVGAAVALGVLLGRKVLRGEGRKPVMIGAHLLLGASGLESLVMLLHGMGEEQFARVGGLGKVAALVFAASMFIGVTAALCRRSRRTAMVALVSHVGVGLAGFATFVVWLARLWIASPG